MSGAPDVLGAVLAGGAGRRIGGDKMLVEVDGRPLLHYPVRALRAVLGEVVVVCKELTALPSMLGLADVWCEPDEPRHPLAGVAWALRRAGGRAVLACPGDLALVTPEAVRALLDAGDEEPGAAVVVAHAAGRVQPLLGLWRPAALPALDGMAPGARATAVAEALDPVVVALADGDALVNVNAPEDVLRASALLAARAAAQPKVNE